MSGAAAQQIAAADRAIESLVEAGFAFGGAFPASFFVSAARRLSSSRWADEWRGMSNETERKNVE